LIKLIKRVGPNNLFYFIFVWYVNILVPTISPSRQDHVQDLWFEHDRRLKFFLTCHFRHPFFLVRQAAIKLQGSNY